MKDLMQQMAAARNRHIQPRDFDTASRLVWLALGIIGDRPMHATNSQVSRDLRDRKFPEAAFGLLRMAEPAFKRGDEDMAEAKYFTTPLAELLEELVEAAPPASWLNT